MNNGHKSGNGAWRRMGSSAGIGRRSEHFLLEPVLELSRALSPGIDFLQDARGMPIAASAAMRELLIVHRIEQARLLLRASRMRAASTPLGRLFLALCAPDLQESNWPGEAAEELDACLFDGWEIPALLAACVARSPVDWPSARELARAAFALEPSLATRLQLVRAELCEGELCEGMIGRAFDRMQRLHATHPSGRDDRDLREGLALTSEAQGRWADARAHYRALCARNDARPAAHAASLAVALRMGDLWRARAARSRLIESGESALADELRRTQALSRLQARIRFHRDRGRWQYTNEVHTWILGWQREGSEGRLGAAGRLTADITRALL